MRSRVIFTRSAVRSIRRCRNVRSNKRRTGNSRNLLKKVSFRNTWIISRGFSDGRLQRLLKNSLLSPNKLKEKTKGFPMGDSFLFKQILILMAVLYGIGGILALDAVMRGRTAQGSIAWAISLITFPFVAVPLYLFLGRNKFFGYIEARRAGNLE